MTYRRGSRYYIKRRFSGIGLVWKSLGTTSLTRARRLESMIVSLFEGGRADVVRAFHEGRLTVAEIGEYFESGRIHELVAQLNAPDPVKLQDAIGRALAHKSGDVRAGTLERYTTGLEHFQRISGDVWVSDALRDEAVHHFKMTRVGEGVARETVNNDLIAVGLLATYALDQGWVQKKPKIRKFRSQTRISYLDPDQVTLYMAWLRPAFRVQMQTLIGTGLRLSEVEGLTVGDVRAGRLIVKDAKSGDVRAAHAPDWVLEALAAHIDTRGLSGSDRLFTIKRRTVQAEHARACRQASIEGYTIHDHRHTAAVALARAGIPLPVLQRQLGHKNIATTMKYASFHPSYDDARPYFETVAEAFGIVSVVDNTGYTPRPDHEGAR